MNQQKGFSIVESMVAITLGLILLAGVLYIFASNKQSFSTQSGMARVQENGRYAKFILSNDIRLSGYQGCPKINAIEPQILADNLPANGNLTSADMLVGFKNGTSTLPTWLSNNLASGTSIIPNTDVIVIRRASPISASLSVVMDNASDNISLTGPMAFTPGELLLISDCESVDLFRASTGTRGTTITHRATNNSSGELSKAYQTDAKVHRMQTFAYYLKESGRTNAAGQPIISLYRQDINGNEEELMDGVENLQATYGLDTNNDGSVDTFQNAVQVEAGNNWSNVITVDVALLLNSIDNVQPEPTRFTYLGTTTTPSDRLLRRQWDSFVQLRNRFTN